MPASTLLVIWFQVPLPSEVHLLEQSVFGPGAIIECSVYALQYLQLKSDFSFVHLEEAIIDILSLLMLGCGFWGVGCVSLFF